MRRPILATVATSLVLAAVAGCGKSPEDSARDSAADGKTAAQAWTEARGRLTTAGSAGYDARVAADGLSMPVSQESGTFTLAPESSQSRRTFSGIDEATSKPRQYVVRVRQTAAGQNFLQLDDWGTWEGCWLPMDPAALEAQTGVEVAGAPRLPTGVRVLMDASVRRNSGSASEPVAEASAVSVLQFLGVSAAALSDVDKGLGTARVPVVLGVDGDGDPAGVSANGLEVLHALAEAGVALPSNLSDYVGKARAELALRDLGTARPAAAPRVTLRLPAHPAKRATCPANR